MHYKVHMITWLKPTNWVPSTPFQLNKIEMWLAKLYTSAQISPVHIDCLSRIFPPFPSVLLASIIVCMNERIGIFSCVCVCFFLQCVSLSVSAYVNMHAFLIKKHINAIKVCFQGNPATYITSICCCWYSICKNSIAFQWVDYQMLTDVSVGTNNRCRHFVKTVITLMIFRLTRY